MLTRVRSAARVLVVSLRTSNDIANRIFGRTVPVQRCGHQPVCRLLPSVGHIMVRIHQRNAQERQSPMILREPLVIASPKMKCLRGMAYASGITMCMFLECMLFTQAADMLSNPFQANGADTFKTRKAFPNIHICQCVRLQSSFTSR